MTDHTRLYLSSLVEKASIDHTRLYLSSLVEKASIDDIKTIFAALKLTSEEYDRVLASVLTRIHDILTSKKKEIDEWRLLLDWMLQNGADPYHAHSGRTFLHYLGPDPQVIIQRMEIAKQAGIRLQDVVNLGSYSLLVAQFNYTSVIGTDEKFLQYMLAHGADINDVDTEHRTMAFYIRDRKDAHCFKYCDLTRRDINGHTSLVYRCNGPNVSPLIEDLCMYPVDQDFTQAIKLLGSKSHVILNSSGYKDFLLSNFTNSHYAEGIPKDITNMIISIVNND